MRIGVLKLCWTALPFGCQAQVGADENSKQAPAQVNSKILNSAVAADETCLSGECGSSMLQLGANPYSGTLSSFAGLFNSSVQKISNWTKQELPFPCTDEVVLDSLSCADFGWKKATRKRRVFDAFAYNNERDVLEARRRELLGFVNGTAVLSTEANFHGELHETVHVSPASDVRHVKLPRAAYAPCWDASLQTYISKCCASVAHNSNALAVEEFNPNEDDWVIHGDVDEIPNRHVARLLQECDVPIGPQMEKHALYLGSIRHYMYDTGCYAKSSDWVTVHKWRDFKPPVAVKVGTMRKYGFQTFHSSDAHKYCHEEGPYAACINQKPLSIRMPCAAWHLSSFGGSSALAKKRSDNSDTYKEVDGSALSDLTKACKEGNEDRDRYATMSRTDVGNLSYPLVPHSLTEDPERFKVFFPPSSP